MRSTLENVSGYAFASCPIEEGRGRGRDHKIKEKNEKERDQGRDVTYGGPGSSVCEQFVFLPTVLISSHSTECLIWHSVGAGLLPNLFLLAINTHKREREFQVTPG